MKILVLDYDWVIADSSLENLIVSLNTYLNFFPHTELFGGKKIKAKDAKIIERYPDDLKNFIKISRIVRTAAEHVAAIMALDEGASIESQKEFLDLIEGIPKEKMQEFQKQFYVEREELKKDLKSWCKLTVPYKKVIEGIRSLDVEKYIITNRDKKAIVSILSEVGLKIPEDRILDKDVSLDKREKVKILMKKYDCNANDILFIDDNLRNLVELHEMGVNCFFPTWAPISKDEMEEDIHTGIKPVSEDNFVNISRGLYNVVQ